MEENKLRLKSVQDLLGYSFYVPCYQRGYRWKETHVKDLLKDIWDFIIHPPLRQEGRKAPFYCLQPIVVTPGKAGSWEVIDGQQRLTTIFLILKNLEMLIDGEHKNFASIDYQTRDGSRDYLLNIDEDLREKNVDYYHIYQADQTIKLWFHEMGRQHSSARIKFLTPFLESTKVIWYEVNDGSDAIDIFTRINMGKIPLTNAELIRALFLRKNGSAKNDNSQLKAIRMRIASEWDRIEATLQDDSFWYFIYAGKQNYSSRIEYIFDLMKSKDQESDEFFTFNQFHEDFIDDQRPGPHWKGIKEYFMLFQEWYNDRDLYHNVGFLISSGARLTDIKQFSKGITKTAFKLRLEEEIKKYVKVIVSELEYPDKRVKTVLLLFNVRTILQNPNSSFRFPFDRFRKETWDIEHIRSVKSNKPATNEQRKWLEVVLEYFTGSKLPEEQLYSINSLSGAAEKLAKAIYAELSGAKISADNFDSIYAQVLALFDENDEPEQINFIQNLTLLDAATNRGYKNSVFPIKRSIIISNDMNTSFVPICTKNVFSKSYSSRLDNVMFWSKNDASDYLRHLINTLKPYLPKQSNEQGTKY